MDNDEYMYVYIEKYIYLLNNSQTDCHVGRTFNMKLYCSSKIVEK